MIKKTVSRLEINSSRVYLDRFAARAAISVPDGARVLDAGAGEGMYRYHFSSLEYESADFCQIDKTYGEITYVCDLADIPVESDRYDLVFCSQTLEHVPEPFAVLKEFFRVLKPGGKLWLSAPLFYEEHEVPYDYFRYTQYGFRYLLESAGFMIQEIEWLEGYFGTLSYQLSTATRSLPTRMKDYGDGLFGFLAWLIGVVSKPAFFCASLIFSRVDLQHRLVNRGYCKNYTIIAAKVT